eukprot:5909173-Prymnesium_polylepis.3
MRPAPSAARTHCPACHAAVGTEGSESWCAHQAAETSALRGAQCRPGLTRQAMPCQSSQRGPASRSAGCKCR